jgi:hypothetical protein
VAAVALFFCTALLVQDYVRYVFFSLDRPDLSVRMDVIWLLLTGALVALPLLSPSWPLFVASWAAASATAALISLFAWRKELLSAERTVRLADTLKLGRWSGLDNLLSIFANLLPMAVTTLALATPLAASYRVLQTALGPLNIINTSLVAGFGLNSHKLNSRAGIVHLSQQVRKSMLLLGAATFAYTSVAFFAIASVAGIDGTVALRVGTILGVAALLGAVTTPAMAAASALGYQAVGVMIRVFVVALSIAISWLAASGGSVPWNDPIGVVAIGAAALGLIGWVAGYLLASRREKAAMK